MTGEDSKIKPVNPKGNQPTTFTETFIGRTEAEAPRLWPPDAKNTLIRKDSDAGKDWRQEDKGMPEDEMVGWHHRLNGHEFEQAPGDGDGQGSPPCHSQLGCKESDATEQQRLEGAGICPRHRGGRANEEEIMRYKCLYLCFAT